MEKISRASVEQYRKALERYKKACSTFHKVRLGYRALSQPNQMQEFTLFQATKTFKEECRRYQNERVLWIVAMQGRGEAGLLELMKDASIKDLASTMPDTGTASLVKELKREAFEDSEEFKIIKAAAEKYMQKIQDDPNTPMEERVFASSDEVDVFKDLK